MEDERLEQMRVMEDESFEVMRALEDERAEKVRARNDSYKSIDHVNKAREIDELQMVGNMLKRQKLDSSSSSDEVDFVRLCEDIVQKIEGVVRRGNVLNGRQCKILAAKLSVKIACVREVVESCGKYKPAFAPLLAALHRYYERAEILVEQCGEEDWCAAAVFQLGNTASFTYIVRHINSVGMYILECAKEYSVVSATMPSAFPLDVAESCGGDSEDEEELKTRLEVVAKGWNLCSSLIFQEAVLKQHLARFLLTKINYKSQFNRGIKADALEALKSVLWKKENEPIGTWGDSKFLGGGSNVVLETSWLRVPCAKKIFSDGETCKTMVMKKALIMTQLKHPCIVDFICCGNGERREEDFIAMELMEMSLSDLIARQKSVHFSLDVALDIIWQIADGIRFLHENDIHCDLMPTNVVVRKLRSQCQKNYYFVKLLATCMSKVEDKPNLHLDGNTLRYTAPELHPSAHLKLEKVEWGKADAYSFAMTCAHILTLETPFKNLCSSELYSKIMNGLRPIFSKVYPKELVDLVKECWSTNKSERPQFSIIYRKLEKIIFNNMNVPVFGLDMFSGRVGIYEIKEEQDPSKGCASFFTAQNYPLSEEVLTRRDFKIDESGLQNLIGDNIVIDLSSDLLSVTPSGYVIRTSFTDEHGVSQPCVLKRCDVVDQNLPDLARLQHPHVVHLIGFWTEEKYLFLVMEVLDGDLAKLILMTKSASPLSLHVAVDLMLQIAEGMLYLHGMGVSYPLKCENVLYKLTDRNKTEAFRVGDVVVKLGGFGCSRPTQLGSKSQDVLDFGLTCLEILTGDKRSDKGTRSSIPETTPSILKNLIVRCLNMGPTFGEIVLKLLQAKSYILQTYCDYFMVSSEGMEADIVQTKTDCDPDEESSIQRIFAVHQLHPQHGDNPTSVGAILIFFHGFRKVPEEWRRTWMTRDNKLVWPQKWLPEDLVAHNIRENIRVLSVSFDENRTVSNNCNRQEIGKNLVQSLILSPKWMLGETGEAIFLIGHSFGGVLIKYLVTEARHLVQNNTGQQEALKCGKFLERLAKIVFYSVPHASTGQEFENYVSKCKKIAPLKRSSFLQSLEGDTHFVAEMNKLSTDFENAVPEKVKFLAFLEGKAMSKESVLVTEKSCEGAAHSWEWHKIDKDNHFEVCRPNSTDHTGYRILLEHLREHLNIVTSKLDADVTRVLGTRERVDLSKSSELIPAKILGFRKDGSSGSANFSLASKYSRKPSDRSRENDGKDFKEGGVWVWEKMKRFVVGYRPPRFKPRGGVQASTFQANSATSHNVSTFRHGEVPWTASEVSTALTGLGNVARREWVIGLDFGTTYSGFAYARLRSRENPEIFLHYDYPGRRSEKVYCKTFTGLYYGKKEGSENLECSSWGYNARLDYLDGRDKQRVQGNVYLTKFKLLLTRDLNDPELAASIPPPLTPLSIITDYIRLIGEHALSQVRELHDGDEKFGPHLVQWVVTVPSIWDENAKQNMKTCMVNAGLVSDLDALLVVLEPEAASFHCHQILRNQNRNGSLKRADKILVADVGDGTVDIVVQEMVGNGATYQVQELTESSGGLCGGTYVDDSFIRLAVERIPYLDEYMKEHPSFKTRLLKEWEEIKRSFGQSEDETRELSLPNRVADKREAYEKERGNTLEDPSKLELTQQDLKAIFDPVVDGILKLIGDQLQQVPDIKVMFVVGGFGGSPYLMGRIRTRFQGQVRHIVSPPNPGAAIVQGAVLLAFHPEAIVSRIAKKTYGTSVILPFEAGIDPPHLRKITNGVQYCRSRFDVFVRKGDRVEVDNCVTKDYVPHGDDQKVMVFDLWSSREQDPRYAESPSATKEGDFAITLPENFKQPNFELSMFFGRSSIELAAVTPGKQRAGSLVLPVRYCS